MGIMAVPAVGAVLGIAANFLLKPKINTSGSIEEDEPHNSATRGTFVPVIYGERSVGSYMPWYGNYQSYGASSGNAGKGSSQAGTTKRWTCKGIDFLAVGCLDELNSIKFNGKRIFSNPIRRDNTPSGTEIECDDGSIFQIYWGETNQPICFDFWDQVPQGVTGESRFPGYAYIYWVSAEIGESKSWPQRVFRVGADAELTSFGDPATVGEYELIVNPLEPNDDGTGINPAHVLWRCLTGTHGFGAGLDPSMIGVSLQELGLLMEDEHLPTNLRLQNGIAVSQFLDDALTDIRTVMPQVGFELQFNPMRMPTGNIPLLTNKVITDDEFEETLNSQITMPGRTIFQYNNQGQGEGRVNSRYARNDSVFGNRQTSRSETITLTLPTDGGTAQKMADLVQDQKYLVGSVTIRAGREAALLNPGDFFDIEGRGRYMVRGILPSDGSPEVEIDAYVDFFSSPLGNEEVVDPLIGSEPAEAVFDLAQSWWVNDPGGALEGIKVARSRATPGISGCQVVVSQDGTNFSSPVPGSENETMGAGMFLNAWGENVRILDLSGEIPDAVLNLAGAVPDWQAGRQVAWVPEGATSELAYLREIIVQDTGLGIITDLPSTRSWYRFRGDVVNSATGTGDGVLVGSPGFGAPISPYETEVISSLVCSTGNGVTTAEDYDFSGSPGASVGALIQIGLGDLEAAGVPGITICSSAQMTLKVVHTGTPGEQAGFLQFESGAITVTSTEKVLESGFGSDTLGVSVVCSFENAGGGTCRLWVNGVKFEATGLGAIAGITGPITVGNAGDIVLDYFFASDDVLTPTAPTDVDAASVDYGWAEWLSWAAFNPGKVYELVGLVRAQEGTASSTAGLGSIVFIGENVKFANQTSGIVTAGIAANNLSIKGAPRTSSESVDLASITDVAEGKVRVEWPT